jgi:hypothetical protein
MKVGDLVENLYEDGVGVILEIEDDDFYLVHFPSSDVATYWCKDDQIEVIEKVLDKQKEIK